jgi:hypothetical protein
MLLWDEILHIRKLCGDEIGHEMNGVDGSGAGRDRRLKP